MCRICGCTDNNACWDEVLDQPCHWVDADLCSVCARGLIRETLMATRHLLVMPKLLERAGS